MANRQFHLTDDQVKAIKRYERQTRRRDELKHLQATRLYGTGRGLMDIIEIVDCSESSVRLWAMQYKQSGIEGILSRYEKSSQNARKLSVEQEADLCEKLDQYRPEQVMSQDACYATGEFWTVEDLRMMIWQWYGVRFQDASSYRKLLHRCGFSYQKAEQVYKSRPSQIHLADFEAELEKK